MGEVHRIGRRLSLTERLVDVDDALAALAEASPDRAPSRADEPYRPRIDWYLCAPRCYQPGASVM